MHDGKQLHNIFIVLCGTDGTGKSTLSENLISELNSKRSSKIQKYHKINWSTYFLTEYPVKLLRTILIKIVINKRSRISRYAKSDLKLSSTDVIKTKHVHIDKNPLLNKNEKNLIQKLWTLIVLLDDFIYLMTIMKLKRLKYNIISDRYIFDRLVGFKYYNYLTDKQYRRFLEICPKPDITFILTVDPKIALIRETGDKHTLDFYNDLNNMYLDINGANIYQINTKNSLEEITKNMIDIIEAIQNDNK